MAARMLAEHLTKAAQGIAMAREDLQAALRDASPVEAMVLFDSLQTLSETARRVRVLLDSRGMSA